MSHVLPRLCAALFLSLAAAPALADGASSHSRPAEFVTIHIGQKTADAGRSTASADLPLGRVNVTVGMPPLRPAEAAAAGPSGKIRGAGSNWRATPGTSPSEPARPSIRRPKPIILDEPTAPPPKPDSRATGGVSMQQGRVAVDGDWNDHRPRSVAGSGIAAPGAPAYGFSTLRFGDGINGRRPRRP